MYKYGLTCDKYRELSEINFFSNKKLDVVFADNAVVLPPRRAGSNPYNTICGSGGYWIVREIISKFHR